MTSLSILQLKVPDTINSLLTPLTLSVVSSTETFAWDAMGRPLGQMQCTPSTCGASKGYPVYDSYDPLGNVTSSWDSAYAAYPTYDAAGRFKGMTAGLNVNPGIAGPGS